MSDSVDQGRRYWLWRAAAQGDWDMVSHLLAHRTPCWGEYEGKTLLQAAVAGGNAGIVTDVLLRTQDGVNEAYHDAVTNGRQSIIARLLPFAVEAERLERITPVFNAISKHDTDALREQFNQAFLRNEQVKMEPEYLQYALQYGSRDIVQLLVTWGATITMDEVKKLSDPSKHDGYVKMLRACGLRISKG